MGMEVYGRCYSRLVLQEMGKFQGVVVVCSCRPPTAGGELDLARSVVVLFEKRLGVPRLGLGPRATDAALCRLGSPPQLAVLAQPAQGSRKEISLAWYPVDGWLGRGAELHVADLVGELVQPVKDVRRICNV